MLNKSIDIASRDYFDIYRKLRDGFVVCSLVAITKHANCVLRAREIYKREKHKIEEVCTTDNPWLKYKRVIQPSLLEDFTIIANIFHYTKQDNSTPLHKNIFLEVACAITSDLSDALKYKFDVELDSLFDKQFDRMFKEIKKSKNATSNSSSSMVAEIEKTIVYMTILEEYFGRQESIEYIDKAFGIICEILISFALYYIKPSKSYQHVKTLHQEVVEKYSVELNAFYKTLGLKETDKKFYLFEMIDLSIKLLDKPKEEIKKLWKDSMLKDNLIFEDINYDNLLKVRKALGYNSHISKDKTNLNYYIGSAELRLAVYGAKAIDVNNFSIDKEKLDTIIALSIFDLNLFKTNIYAFVDEVINNTRIYVSMNSYIKKSEKKDTPQVKEASKGDIKLQKELKKAKKTIRHLNSELETKELENEQLKAKLAKLQNEQTKSVSEI